MPGRTHDQIIKALGGKTRLAGLIGLPTERLKKWHSRGVPYKYWPQVIEIGAAMKPPVVITHRELEDTKPSLMEPA